MDISSYISELLFEHDCVIIPNFGGFICNYKAADIHPVLNTISPPGKAVSFNRNLQSNDGLLVNHIAKAQHISFDSAFEVVSGWVNSSKHLLNKKEDLFLPKVGKFSNDFEGNLQFEPAQEVNYLKASFGLRTLTVEPIVREKQIDFTEKFKYETKTTASPRRVWSIAASVLLVVCIIALAELMWMGGTLNTGHVDEAGICSLLTHPFSRNMQPEIAPAPAPVEHTTVTLADTVAAAQATVDTATATTVDINPPADDNALTVETTTTVTPTNGHTYYIVIGAFTEQKNIEAAKERLQAKYPDSVILVEKAGRLTKLGYSVGGNFYKAKEELATAQAEDSSFWLLKK